MKKLIIFFLIFSIIPRFVFAENFNGSYFGLNLGYADGKHHGTEYEDDGTLTGWTSKNNSNNILFGGLVGYNKTFTDNLLIGFEADLDYRNASKESLDLYYGSVHVNSSLVENQIKFSTSLRARLGYVFNSNKTLVYLTGGYTGGDIKSIYYNSVYNETSSNSQWHNGWTAGLGLEHFIKDKFSAKVEYRYADFGKEDADVTISVMHNYHQNYDKDNSIRFGINYHF